MNELTLIPEGYDPQRLWRNYDHPGMPKRSDCASSVNAHEIFSYRDFISSADFVYDRLRIFSNRNGDLSLLLVYKSTLYGDIPRGIWYSDSKCFGYKHIYILRSTKIGHQRFPQSDTIVIKQSLDDKWHISMIYASQSFDLGGPEYIEIPVCTAADSIANAIRISRMDLSKYNVEYPRYCSCVESYSTEKLSTPEMVNTLQKNEVFVFNSYPNGYNRYGTAKIAKERFGAQVGVGNGPTGQCYAIPIYDDNSTAQGQKIYDFFEYAIEHPEKQFLVTPIGTGKIFKKKIEDFAPLFRDALAMPNVTLPQSFIDEIIRQELQPFADLSSSTKDLFGKSVATSIEPDNSASPNTAPTQRQYTREYTPDNIQQLAANEIFVFGSNIHGNHGGGAAAYANQHFGAVLGVGEGLTGRCYALPTMEGGINYISGKVNNFLSFASAHPDMKFLVTPIACGIAGFKPADIAPLFANALSIPNVILPKSFVEIIAPVADSTPDETVSTTSNHQTEDTSVTNAPSWDSKEWKARFDIANAQRYTNSVLAEVFQNTVKIVNEGKYTTEQGVQVSINTSPTIEADTKYYSTKLAKIQPTVHYQTAITVQKGDMVEIGKTFVQQYGADSVCILNMANRQTPGGGVFGGARAQEEQLFRRSDYFKSLYQFANFATQYKVTRSSFSYPLDCNFGACFSRSITIFRESQNMGYALSSAPWKVNFVAVPAINNPDTIKVNNELRMTDEMVVGTKNKIRTILRVAYHNGQEHLILGAFGCGAFHNPPKHVAEIFKTVLAEPEFKGAFISICFGILDDHNAVKNGVSNFEAFRQVFSTE